MATFLNLIALGFSAENLLGFLSRSANLEVELPILALFAVAPLALLFAFLLIPAALLVSMRRRRRLDEARQETRRAIECQAEFGHASEPWKTWSILADIETDAGNPNAAEEAKRKAIACYLAYRRDGGENHDSPGRLAFEVTRTLLAGNTAEA